METARSFVGVLTHKAPNLAKYCALLCCLCFLWTSVSAQNGPETGSWSKFQSNNFNTGGSPGYGATGATKWTSRIEYTKLSPIIGPDGTIYETDISFIWAIKPSGGKIWDFNLPQITTTPVLGANGTLYFGTDDVGLLALNSKNGVETGVFPVQGEIDSPPTIGEDGTIYFGADDQRIYAVDTATMTKKWSYETGGLVRSSPALGSNGILYVGSYDGSLYALDSTSGAPLWSFNTGAPLANSGDTANVIESSVAIGSNGLIYFGSDGDYQVYALNAITGELAWTFQTQAGVDATPAIGPDGTVYVGSKDGAVYALDGNTGKQKWAYQTGAPVTASASVGADRNVFIGSTNGVFYALDGAMGSIEWSINTAISGSSSTPAIFGSSAIAADGTVYFGTYNPSSPNYLYAVSATETNSLAHFYVSVPQVVGGQALRGVVQLSQPAGRDGLSVALSSNTRDVSITPNIEVPSGNSGRSFAFGSSIVSAPETATLTATVGSSSLQTTLTLDPYPVSNLYATPSVITGGQSTSVVVQLAGPAGPNGNQITLSRSDGGANQIVTVPAGKKGISFPVTTSPVSNHPNDPTILQLAASEGAVARYAQVTVSPYQLLDFYCSPVVVVGGEGSRGVIRLSGPAGLGGNLYNLSSGYANVQVPQQVTIPAGQSGVSFPIKTSSVTSAETITLTVQDVNANLTATVTLNPNIASFSISPNTVKGGQVTSGLAKLTGSAGPGGESIRLSVGSGEVVTPAVVRVPAGQSSVSFPITTRAVGKDETVTVRATVGSFGMSTTVTLTP